MMLKKSGLRGKRKKKKGTVEVMVNRGAWTAEEDQKLTEYVKAHGDKNWRSLPARAGLNRCGKSCRLRWLNYLRPGIKRGNISDDEEDLIIRLHNLLGNRWSLIAGRLPGRTDNEIKNHWNTHLSRRSVTIHDLNLRLNQKKNMDAAARPRDQPVTTLFLSSHDLPMIDSAPDHARGEDGHSILDEVIMEPLQYILSPNRTELDMERQLLGIMPNLNDTNTNQLARGNCGRDRDFIGHLEISPSLDGCYPQSAAWDVSASDFYINALEDLAFFLLD